MKFFFLTCLIVIVILASCTQQRYIYNPPVFINPSLTVRGQTDIGVSYSTGPADGPASHPGNNKGLDAHTAFAVSDHFTVIAAYSLRNEKDSYEDQWNPDLSTIIDNSTVRYQRNIVQAGGLYSHLFAGKGTGISLAVLLGHTSNWLSDQGVEDVVAYSSYFDFKGNMVSVQPALNFGQKKSFKWSLVTRLNFLSISSLHTNYTTEQLSRLGLLDVDKATMVYSALGMMTQYQVKKMPWLKFNGQFMISSSGGNGKYLGSARGSLCSGGVSIDFSRMGDP